LIISGTTASVSCRTRVKLSVTSSFQRDSGASILSDALPPATFINQYVDLAQALERYLRQPLRGIFFHNVHGHYMRLQSASSDDFAGKVLQQIGASRGDADFHALGGTTLGDRAAASSTSAASPNPSS